METKFISKKTSEIVDAIQWTEDNQLEIIFILFGEDKSFEFFCDEMKQYPNYTIKKSLWENDEFSLIGKSLCRYKDYFDENDKFVCERQIIDKFSYLVKKGAEISVYSQNEFEQKYQKLDKLKIK